jgi:hypothetical protein
MHRHWRAAAVWGRLWERLGIAEVLGQLLEDRGFEFADERAFSPASTGCSRGLGSRLREKWMDDYRITGIEEPKSCNSITSIER